MTKDELARAVQDSLQRTPCRDFGKDDIKTVIEHTLDNIKATLDAGEAVTLRGFGTFKPKRRKAKAARDIKKGTRIEVPAKTVVSFKPSKEFTAQPPAEGPF